MRWKRVSTASGVARTRHKKVSFETKINSYKSLTKLSILDVCGVPEYASDTFQTNIFFPKKFNEKSKYPKTDRANITAKNTIVSPDYVVWKFCGKTQFPHSFGRFALNYAEAVPFRKLYF